MCKLFLIVTHCLTRLNTALWWTDIIQTDIRGTPSFLLLDYFACTDPILLQCLIGVKYIVCCFTDIIPALPPPLSLSLFSVHKVSWMVTPSRVSWQSTRSTTRTWLCAATLQLMTSLMWWREIGKLLKCQNGPSLVIPSGWGLLKSSVPFRFPLLQCGYI